MNINNEADIEKIDKKIGLTDYILIGALVVTLVSTFLALIYRGKQNELLKKQRIADRLEISRANESSEIAKKEAAIANQNAAISNEIAKKTELKNNELQIKLLRLRLETTDRTIPSTTEPALLSELKKYKNQKVLINAFLADEEVTKFSKKINELFISAGWQSKLNENNNVMYPAPTGIKIIAFGSDNQKIANFLKYQFENLSYSTSISFQEKIVDLDIQIIIYGH